MSPLTVSPVVNRHPDGIGSKITAQHFVFGNAAQRVSYALLSDFVSFFDMFAQNHLRRHRRAGDGHRAAHAFEFHVLDDVILDLQCYQDRVTVHRTADDGFAGGVGYAAHVSRVGVMLANFLAIQSYSLA